MQRLLLAGSLPTVRQGSDSLQGIAHIANNRELPDVRVPEPIIPNRALIHRPPWVGAAFHCIEGPEATPLV